MDKQNTPDKERFAPPEDVTKSKKFNISNIKNLLKTKPTKRQMLMIGGVGIGIAALTGLLVTSLSNKSEPVLEPIVTQEIVVEPIAVPETIASNLTGVQVSRELNDRPVTAIMIENSIDARPQAGLIDAGVVFEAIAEGGITRFLSLFQINQPESIGPIRSARPYYVEWTAGFDASYVHSGGSGEALALVRSLGLKDMDHGNYPSYFDRVSNRYAPHNVYTSMARLDSLRESKGFTTSTFEAFARIEESADDKDSTSEDTKAETPAVPATAKTLANNISFNISSPLYNTSYTYNADTNTYARVMANQKHLDETTGNQISPSVVVALITAQGFHPDGIHTTYKTIGSGTLMVFQNGEFIEGRWSKAGNKEPLKFTTLEGGPLELQPGQTWITAIPSGRVTHTP